MTKNWKKRVYLHILDLSSMRVLEPSSRLLHLQGQYKKVCYGQQSQICIFIDLFMVFGRASFRYIREG